MPQNKLFLCIYEDKDGEEVLASKILAPKEEDAKEALRWMIADTLKVVNPNIRAYPLGIQVR